MTPDKIKRCRARLEPLLDITRGGHLFSDEREAFKTALSCLDELTKLQEFADYILQEFSWQGGDVDGGSAQDKAGALGLIELRPIPEEDSIDGEKEHYFTKWTPKEAK